VASIIILYIFVFTLTLLLLLYVYIQGIVKDKLELIFQFRIIFSPFNVKGEMNFKLIHWRDTIRLDFHLTLRRSFSASKQVTSKLIKIDEYQVLILITRSILMLKMNVVASSKNPASGYVRKHHSLVCFDDFSGEIVGFRMPLGECPEQLPCGVCIISIPSHRSRLTLNLELNNSPVKKGDGMIVKRNDDGIWL